MNDFTFAELSELGIQVRVYLFILYKIKMT